MVMLYKRTTTSHLHLLGVASEGPLPHHPTTNTKNPLMIDTYLRHIVLHLFDFLLSLWRCPPQTCVLPPVVYIQTVFDRPTSKSSY